MSCVTERVHDIQIKRGAPESQRRTAASLYDAAFGEKFKLAIPDAAARLQLFDATFHLEHCIAALCDARLVGIAGYSTDTGSLTSGITWSSLKEHLGWFGAVRAAIVFSLYERKKRSGELMMDGISVDADFRSQGVGTRLLTELIDCAKDLGYSTIRLDVIDTNQAAQRMYERNDFRAVKTEKFEFARSALGFGAATTMIRKVA